MTLRSSRVNVGAFGASLASGGDLLLVGGRLEHEHPFATLYRMTPEGVVRERVLRGSEGHEGPSLATDGTRVVVGQPAVGSGTGFVSIYERVVREGEPASLELEATLELKPEEGAACTGFGQVVALQGDLLVVGQPASVSIYRHSAVGWLCAATPRPALPYEWNPQFGLSCAVLGSRVLVGNPVEIDGHRAGPGRVFVYRQEGDSVELETELLGDGIEGGREEPNVGFGASIEVSGEFVLVTAPWELSSTGLAQSRVYVYRASSTGFARVATIEVPSVERVCMAGERLFVLGDELYVFGRRGNEFTSIGTYPVNGATANEVSMTASGSLLMLGYPAGHDDGEIGEVALHFADQL